LGLCWNSNETGEAGIKPAVFGERKSSNMANPFARQRKWHLSRARKRKKPFARCVRRKRSWSLSCFLLYPMSRAPYVGHRVDGFTGPFKAGDLLPFQLQLFYN
jgi:hypothetical protein